MRLTKKIGFMFCTTAMILSLTSCAGLQSKIQDIKGDITGATYVASFYSNNGDRFMTVQGEKINMHSNIVKEA